MQKLVLVLLISLIAIQYNSAWILNSVPQNCSGSLYDIPLLNDTPVLVAQVQNGQKYQIPYEGRNITILNLTGNAYEMGYAMGTLMKDELSWIIANFFPYIVNEVETAATQYVPLLDKLPSWASKLGTTVLTAVLKTVLNLNYEICKKYIPQRFNDEMQGIADASGLNIWDIRGTQMFPELIKAACSILGVWNEASLTSQLFHLRSLDFDAGIPIAQYPQITVYHSTEQGSYPFANIGWTGYIGTISGYGTYVGIGEKQGNLQSKNTTRFGKPWTFALRDTLQFSKTIDDALNILEQTNRTCSIYLGVGSKVNNTFRLLEENADQFLVYTDMSFEYDSGIQNVNGILFKQEHSAYCFRNVLYPNYGQIDASLIRNLCTVDQTGNAQIAIYDYMRNYIYVGYPDWQNQTPAYSLSTAFINLNPFFTGNEDY